jgi:inactivated superfamily I helicase
MLQLQLLSLARTEEELVAVDVTVRAELVDLMARILVTVFQTETRRIDERASIQPEDQAGTLGS